MGDMAHRSRNAGKATWLHGGIGWGLGRVMSRHGTLEPPARATEVGAEPPFAGADPGMPNLESFRTRVLLNERIKGSLKHSFPSPPRVLVIGEVSGVWFRLCLGWRKLKWRHPSEIDNVPHFQEGDCKHIQDQGWDLVIAHPPCTYLSAVGAGAGWLKKGARKGAGGTLRG